MDQLSLCSPSPTFRLRPLCAAALGFAGGILLFEALRPLPWAAALSAAALLSASFLFRLRNRRGPGLFFLFAALGLLRAELALAPALPQSSGRLLGTVALPAAKTEAGFRVLLKDAALNGVPLPGRIELTLPADLPDPACGRTLILRGSLSPVSPEETYRRYLRVSGVFAPAGPPLILSGPPGLMGRISRLSALLCERIALLFPADPGLACAMLIGQRALLDPAGAEAMYASGIGHLIAVSGLHVGILAGALSRVLPRSRRIPHLIAMACFLLCYSLLCGLSPSVIRASLLFLLFQLAALLRRPYDLPSALAAAGLLILAANPACLFYAGFQLSFLAIFGLIALYPLLRPGLTRRLGETGKLLAGSLSVTLSTAPASAALFSRLSLLSIPANLIALPLAPAFLIPGAAALLISFLSLPLGRLLARIPNLVLGIYPALSRIFSPGAIPLQGPPLPAVLLYLFGLLLLSPLCLRPRAERRRLSALALLGALLCTLC